MRCPKHKDQDLEVSRPPTAGASWAFADIHFRCPKGHGYIVRVRHDTLIPDNRELPLREYEEKRAAGMVTDDDGTYEVGSC